MKLYEVNGTYGSGKTPCTVFVAENRDGSKWYVCEGSQNVNLTYDEISDGVNVEELSDEDCFTGITVNSLEDLEQAIEA
jgi:hypothetical protein